MKIIELQRKGDNLYLLTYEVKTFWYDKTESRLIYDDGIFVKFCDNNEVVYPLSGTIQNLIKHLKGYEPLKVNNI